MERGYQLSKSSSSKKNIIMSDFHQNGIIATLHNFNEKNIDDIEKDLLKFSENTPMTLILPSLYSELERPALTYIVNTLKKIKYIKNLIIGLEIVEKEIISTLEKHNVKQIDPLGEKFDYNFHQAMFEVPTNEEEPGKVVEVSQKGYVLHDRLVRPAMVGISKKIEENDNDKNAIK